MNNPTIKAQERRIAIKAALEKDGWQPIETAPKDGTTFIGVNLHAKEPKSAQYFYNDGDFKAGDPEDWERLDTEYNLSGFDILGTNLLTHWMPLPAPPKAAQEG